MKKTLLLITFCLSLYAQDSEYEIINNSEEVMSNINENAEDSKQHVQTPSQSIVIMPLEALITDMAEEKESK